MQIKDLVKNENNIDLIIVADKVTQVIASNGNSYLIVILKDKTGMIEGRLWDVTQYDLEKLVSGNIYKVNVNIIKYRNGLQARINKYDAIESSMVNIEDFIEVAPINIDVAYNEIIKTIDNLQNSVYKKIMCLIFKKYGEKFKIWPAAIKNHHEVKSGLIWHNITMLRMAKEISKIYYDRLIDFDLLYCGIILHDMGKIIEINAGTINNFSLEGKLIGHISIMINELHRIAYENDIDIKYLIYLKHLIIASHGRLEYGSPIEPHLLEAEILSFLDNFDARIYIIDKELEKIHINDQTPRIFAVDNRWFIKHIEKNNLIK